MPLFVAFDLYLGCRVGIFARWAVLISQRPRMSARWDLVCISGVCHVCRFCSAVLGSGGDYWCALKFVRNLSVGNFSGAVGPSRLMLGVIVAATDLYAIVLLLVTCDLWLGHRVSICARRAVLIYLEQRMSARRNLVYTSSTSDVSRIMVLRIFFFFSQWC